MEERIPMAQMVLILLLEQLYHQQVEVAVVLGVQEQEKMEVLVEVEEEMGSRVEQAQEVKVIMVGKVILAEIMQVAVEEVLAQ